jgi:hypothetical protein
MFLLILLPTSPELIAQQEFRFIAGDCTPLVGLAIELHHEAVTEAQDGVSIIDQVNRTFVPMIRVINPGQSVSLPNNSARYQ